MLKANIYVTLKPGVLDPQGEAVKNALQVMDYADVDEVRIGKYIQVCCRVTTGKARDS